jgi:hypothetical protein
LKVYEIVAQREPHTDVDPLEIGVLIRYAVWNCQIQFISIITVIYHEYRQICFKNILEMNAWHQKFLQIVQRNFENWWKCVGKKNLINVLYPFLLFLVYVFFSAHKSSLPFSSLSSIFTDNSMSFFLSFIYWQDFETISKILEVWGNWTLQYYWYHILDLISTKKKC